MYIEREKEREGLLFLETYYIIFDTFYLDTFKLLNKNLNFVPTPKKYNKKQLDNDAENLFCQIKLRAHFKDINPKSNTDQENLPFQIKNKQKWTPKDTHHNISTFIDLL